jgi:CRP/FNR family transcriptional regulator, cyclic AMP receptor protein
VPHKSDVFHRIPLFSGLAETEWQALAGRSMEKQYAAEEVLFWEGEPCAGMFVIAQGSVKIFKTSPGGREMMLALESAPSTVAELPLFDGGPYPASVRAVEAVTAYFINKADFYQVCRQYPDVALKVLAVVGGRLRHLVAVVEAMTFGSVTQRLARMLLDSGRPGQGEFELPTHQELASRLGTVREVVSRNLARFRAEGLLRVEGRQMRILDRAGLEREASPQE